MEMDYIGKVRNIDRNFCRIESQPPVDAEILRIGNTENFEEIVRSLPLFEGKNCTFRVLIPPNKMAITKIEGMNDWTSVID